MSRSLSTSCGCPVPCASVQSRSAGASLSPKQTLAAANPAMANVDVTQAYDKSFLQKLFDMGFYTQIGNPEKPF